MEKFLPERYQRNPMQFNKFLHASNFDFPSALDPKDGSFASGRSTRRLELDDLGNDILRLTATGGSWSRNESKLKLFPDGAPKPGTSSVRAELSASPLGLQFVDNKGRVKLKSSAKRTFGICGESFLMGFDLQGDERFYGMGEKFLGLELSNKRTKFWNTDAMGDFPHDVFTNGRPDPAYVSIPYLILRTSAGWVGILVHNPGAVMMDTGAAMDIEGFIATSDGERYLLLGAEHGQPDLFFIFADTLPALTRKFQSLVGTTPLPPVWSLGYHQCRWGYASAADMKDLKTNFDKAQFPVDGLWLDIDYMRGYRVFTFSDQHFPEVEADLDALQKDGQRVIPIIDPGVKIDPDWEVYRDGEEKNVFCKNPQNRTFVGQVWPGDTAFVDYTQKHGFAWWRDQVASFAARGIHGCWNDMNDPSLGFVESTPMRFSNGRKDHWTYHNQFAKGMAEATREGFLKAHPEERPFILSRSGSTGMGRAAAIWHGDSSSNYHWLQLSIPTALNLSLSGVPMNGPDLGGFGGDTNKQLLLDYFKACFLFPFCRNHTAINTKLQEPWALDKETLTLSREYIRARYRLRPYLYQLFAEHETTGEAILRPMFYDLPATEQEDFAHCEDQFMVGPALLQAPLLTEERRRKVKLPKGRWWNFMTGRWIEGGRDLAVKPADDATPIFGRAGQAVTLHCEEPTDHTWRTENWDVHLFLEPGSKQHLKTSVVADDGLGFGYQRGERSRVAVSARVKGDSLAITARQLENGYGELPLGFVLYGNFKEVTLNRKPVKTEPFSYRLAGRDQKTRRIVFE
jgi:alpha-glucosidase